MKKIIQLKSWLVAVLLLTCLVPAAKASHQQGADLIYQCIAPNTYQVTLKFYRDCSGIAAANTYTLATTSKGCNAGRTFTMNKIGTPKVGIPYCPNIPVTCSGTGRPNYEEHIYAATVTFSAAEQACTDWILSVTFNDGNRPTTANISGAPVMYTEAFLKLDSNINNNSPEFSPLNVPVPFVCWNQDISYSLNAAEPDGDSLSYKLVAPLQAANTPVTYLPVNGGSGTNVILNPTDSTKFAIITGVTGNFTPTYPLVSYTVDWSGPNPHHGVKFFNLDPITGVLKFNPSIYKANTSPGAGANKYNVAIEITEWRKINGIVTKVGMIRRDMLFIVEDCFGNKLPVTSTPPTKPLIHATFRNDTILNVQTCITTPIRIVFIDPNNDQLDVHFSAAKPAIPNSQGPIVTGNKTDTVVALLYVTPDVTDEGKDYYLPVVIEDNSCPIKGIVNLVYRIHVVKQDLAFIDGNKVQTICSGDQAELKVLVNRPDSIMHKPVTAATTLDSIHYTYVWQPAPGLSNDDLNKKVVSVKPTVDTRYYVQVNSDVTGCFDTTSVLVRVNQKPDIKSILVGYGELGGQTAGDNLMRFGSFAPLHVTIGNTDTTGFTYSWTPNTNMYKNFSDMKAGITDSTTQNPIVAPLKNTEYTLTVKSKGGQCVSEKKVTVNVGPFFLPNIITPNGDGINDFFEFRGIEPNTLVQIFNRWGVRVKEYKSYNNEFDGKDLADGTYYYFVKEANGKSYKGWLEIVH